jgi:stage II sporulation protein AB (anti-sigma F factor)
MDFPVSAQNEAFARMAVANFASQLNPTMDELSDIKKAIKEAIVNCAIHAYPNGFGKIKLTLIIAKKTLYIILTDWGVGISDLKQAMQPLFTTRPDIQRSGMGFSFMEAFMDRLMVESEVGKGTTVYMSKTITN